MQITGRRQIDTHVACARKRAKNLEGEERMLSKRESVFWDEMREWRNEPTVFWLTSMEVSMILGVEKRHKKTHIYKPKTQPPNSKQPVSNTNPSAPVKAEPSTLPDSFFSLFQ